MTPLEDSDFTKCEDEDGREYYQLNIEEGYKTQILKDQGKTMVVTALAKEIEFLRGKIEEFKKKIDATAHKCDCEYGGCRHSFAEELKGVFKGV